MANILLIISILLVVLAVGATIWKKKELPESISAMVWELPDGGWRWLWSVWLIFVSVLTFAPVIEILETERGLGVMGFVPMVLLCFVAVWPLFDKEHLKCHYILSYIAGIWSQVDVFFMCPWWLLLWLVYVAFLVYAAFAEGYPSWLKGKAVFIAETICYLTVICSEIVH